MRRGGCAILAFGNRFAIHKPEDKEGHWISLIYLLIAVRIVGGLKKRVSACFSSMLIYQTRIPQTCNTYLKLLTSNTNVFALR